MTLKYNIKGIIDILIGAIEIEIEIEGKTLHFLKISLSFYS